MKMSQAEAGKLGGIVNAQRAKERHKLKVEAYLAKPKHCQNCLSPLSYADASAKKTFCNRSCSASFNNKQRATPNSCVQCGNDCRNKFCSRNCQATHYRQTRLEAGTASFKIVKSHLKTSVTACQICGTSEWLGKPIMLIGDHIDGNSENNAIENIRLICSNCDETLSTYKSRNRGNGREVRRQRYVDGKSY